ncbi:MAG: hypothetical protein JWN86_802 [Planctomycetota bacterium]|nr:hypothetical protein [Planctomycetota bacterium]
MDPQSFLFRGRPFLRFPRIDPHQPDSPFVVARILSGRYSVSEPFAVGETSVVLAARDLRTDRDVLIKAVRTDAILPAPPGVEPNAWRIEELRRARHGLQTERRLLVRLRNADINAVPHPNDFVYDVNADLDAIEPAMADREPYLVLQKLSGATLEAVISQEFPRGMNALDAVRLLLPIVQALAFLEEPWQHDAGPTWHVVYQDLKPANLVIGPAGRATLLDFGGCQVVVNGVPVLAGSHTSGYSPPECHGPPRVLLPCADVYTIGATFFHALSGLDPIALFADHVQSGRPPGEFVLDASALPRRTPPPLRSILASCLAPRPSDRLADARQVANQLVAWRNSATNDLADTP